MRHKATYVDEFVALAMWQIFEPLIVVIDSNVELMMNQVVIVHAWHVPETKIRMLYTLSRYGTQERIYVCLCIIRCNAKYSINNKLNQKCVAGEFLTILQSWKAAF